MNCRILEPCVLALFFGAAQAQTLPPVQPQPGLQNLIEIETRLKRADGSTARLLKETPPTIDARTFVAVIPCWNRTTTCPQIVSATVQLYIRLPWSTRMNVTRFVLCNGSECLLPPFAALQARPGEAYRFRYDRVSAQWAEPPTVIPAP